MIIGLFIAAVALGIAVGLVADELLRGRDPRSRYVVVAGIVGALGGLIARRVVGPETVLLDALSALTGALLLAFLARVRMSATIAATGW